MKASIAANGIQIICYQPLGEELTLAHLVGKQPVVDTAPVRLKQNWLFVIRSSKVLDRALEPTKPAEKFRVVSLGHLLESLDGTSEKPRDER